MKTKTSMTNIVKYYPNVFRCGYCDLQYIMRGTEPRYYNAGTYGWNCDIYVEHGIAITTGYRNMRGKRIPDELIEEYTNNAKNIISSYYNRANNMSYEEFENLMEQNRIQFVKAVKGA